MSVLRQLYFPKHSEINEWTEVSVLSSHYLSKQKVFQGKLLIGSQNQVEESQEVVLTSSYLSYRIDKNLHILNIKWSVIDGFIDETPESKRFGFRVKLTESKNFEFFAESSNDLDHWLDNLASVAFLTSFENYFFLVKPIQKREFYEFLLSQSLHQSLFSKNKFVVKRIPTQHLSTIENKNQVFNEISILRKLSHPSIAKLVSSFEERDFLYLVLNCSYSTSLDTLLGTEFEEVDLIRFAKKLLEMVNFVHSNGIILRNLRLENIFVYQGLEDFKVCDFLGSCIIGKHRKCEFHEESPGTEGPKSLSTKTDVFAVGVILFQLAAGVRLKTKEWKKTKQGVWTRSSRKCRISEAGKQFLNDLLNEDPFLRPTAQEALNYAWFERISCLKSYSRMNSKKMSEGSTTSKLTVKYET